MTSGAVASVFDLEARARKRLPKVIFDYVRGGSYEEITLRRNRDDLRALALRQRDLCDVSNRDTTGSMLGERTALPLAIAPTGLAGLAWANGECVAAQAAEAFGIPFCLSTMSICSIEDVAGACRKPFWFQLYLMKQREINERLIGRAHEAGCSALVLTLDLHAQGHRWADTRNGLSVPPRLTPRTALDLLSHPRWLLGMAASRRRTFGNLEGEVEQAKNLLALSQWIEAQFDPSFDAESVKWVRRLWPRKFVLKGIMHADDARAAADLGADAIVVSNHGGRQLDGAPSSISVLPEIAAAVPAGVEVWFDGGIRTGFDVFKAMARGAHACLIGRAYLYGLGAAGGPGVTCALTLIRKELDDCMALTGVRNLRQIPPETVAAVPPLA